jgi:F0F1-type ATP synthase delta subunit
MSTLEGLHSIKDFKAGEKVMVISAVPLDPGRRDMLSKMLRQHLVVSGEPDFLVNSSLGGGILIQAGEEILDRTVFSRFKQMWGDAA